MILELFIVGVVIVSAFKGAMLIQDRLTKKKTEDYLERHRVYSRNLKIVEDNNE